MHSTSFPDFLRNPPTIEVTPPPDKTAKIAELFVGKDAQDYWKGQPWVPLRRVVAWFKQRDERLSRWVDAPSLALVLLWDYILRFGMNHPGGLFLSVEALEEEHQEATENEIHASYPLQYVRLKLRAERWKESRRPTERVGCFAVVVQVPAIKTGGEGDGEGRGAGEDETSAAGDGQVGDTLTAQDDLDIASWRGVEEFARSLPDWHGDVVRLLAQGWDKTKIARKLVKSRSAVKDAIRQLKAKAAEFFGVEEHPVCGWQYIDPQKRPPGRYLRPTLHSRLTGREKKSFDKKRAKLKKSVSTLSKRGVVSNRGPG